jgi:hypothetical protein
MRFANVSAIFATLSADHDLLRPLVAFSPTRQQTLRAVPVIPLIDRRSFHGDSRENTLLFLLFALAQNMNFGYTHISEGVVAVHGSTSTPSLD